MKLLAVLLTVYVLLLAIMPCCADDCIDKTSSKKEFTGKSSPVQKECRGCSPFFSCGTCAGFIVTAPLVHVFKSAEVPVKHNSEYQQPNLKQIALSVWQPPQLS